MNHFAGNSGLLYDFFKKNVRYSYIINDKKLLILK